MPDDQRRLHCRHDVVGRTVTRKEPHRYTKRPDGQEVCELCGHTITKDRRADIDLYRTSHPNLLPLL
jgi:hypothetical protein